MPNYIWLSTGSKTGFKQEVLLSVKDYKIIVYPDKTEYKAWNKKAILLNKEGFKIESSIFFRKY